MSTMLQVRCSNIIIASGDTDSLPIREFQDVFDYITIFSPSSVPETMNFQVSSDFDWQYTARKITLAAAIAEAHWVTAPDGNATIAGNGIASSYFVTIPASAYRMHANGPAAADRVFSVWKKVLRG